MVLGRWSCRPPLRHCPSPQNAIMKAQMLVGVLVVMGFAVGKGEWGPGPGRKGVGLCPWVHRFLQGRDLGGSSAPIPLSSSVPVPELRTCHLCLLEDPSAGCISGSEKCTISSSPACMVITIYHSEFKAQGGAAGETAHCLVSDEDYLGPGAQGERRILEGGVRSLGGWGNETKFLKLSGGSWVW